MAELVDAPRGAALCEEAPKSLAGQGPCHTALGPVQHPRTLRREMPARCLPPSCGGLHSAGMSRPAMVSFTGCPNGSTHQARATTDAAAPGLPTGLRLGTTSRGRPTLEVQTSGTITSTPSSRPAFTSATRPVAEPQDEAPHLRRAQRHLHPRPHRPSSRPDKALRLPAETAAAARRDPFVGTKVSPGGRHQRGRRSGPALRPTVTGRHAHQLQTIHRASPRMGGAWRLAVEDLPHGCPSWKKEQQSVLGKEPVKPQENLDGISFDEGSPAGLITWSTHPS